MQGELSPRSMTPNCLVNLARFDIGPGDTLTARLEAIGGLPEFERRPGARISR
jgi:hypothetical protein